MLPRPVSVWENKRQPDRGKFSFSDNETEKKEEPCTGPFTMYCGYVGISEAREDGKRTENVE